MSVPRPVRAVLALLFLSAAVWVAGVAGLPERSTAIGWIGAASERVAPELGASAPAFTASTATGDVHGLADYRGQVVLLNFWATWCAPCRLEMPILEALHRAHQAEGLRVIAVNVGETVAQVGAWGTEVGVTYPLLLDPWQEVAGLYQIIGQPTTFVIDRAGRIQHVFYGPASDAELQSVLLPLLPG